MYQGKINNQSDLPAVILFDQFSKYIHIYEQINAAQRERECCMVCVCAHVHECVFWTGKKAEFASKTRIGSHVSDWLL